MEEKCVKMPKSNISRQKLVGGTGTKEWYRYHDAVGKWYQYHSNWYRYPLAVDDRYMYQSKWYRYHYFQQPCFDIFFASLSPVFLPRMFRDPKK